MDQRGMMGNRLHPISFHGSFWGSEGPVSDTSHSLFCTRGTSFVLTDPSMIFTADEFQIYFSNTDFYNNSYLQWLPCPSKVI